MPPLRSTTLDKPRTPYDRPTPTAPRNGQWLHDRAPAAATAQPAANNTRLIVSNLHWEVTVKDLISIFSTIGTLAREPAIRVRKHTSGTGTDARFDRSGRSTGVAYIAYSSPTEATRAKSQLDGKIAKTQAMSIAYDTSTPRIPPGVQAAARNGSLLSRVSNPPLISRLSTGDAPKAPAAMSGPGPIRSRPTARGARGGRGRPTAPRVREPKKEKTAADLDKELEAFMGDGGKENGDVEMAA